MSNVRPDFKTFVVFLLILLLILILTLTLYEALFYGLWKRQILLPEQVVTLFADLVFTPAVAAPPKLGPVSEHELDLKRLAPPNEMSFPVVFSSEFCHKLYAPIYPLDSRRLGEEGTVLIQVELSTDGQVDKAEVVNSSGYAGLDNAALTALKHWQCEPIMRDGYAVRAIALQPFKFELR